MIRTRPFELPLFFMKRHALFARRVFSLCFVFQLFQGRRCWESKGKGSNQRMKQLKHETPSLATGAIRRLGNGIGRWCGSHGLHVLS